MMGQGRNWEEVGWAWHLDSGQADQKGGTGHPGKLHLPHSYMLVVGFTFLLLLSTTLLPQVGGQSPQASGFGEVFFPY